MNDMREMNIIRELQSDDSKAVKTNKTESEDDKIMERMGYKQELYRGFGAFMNFSFCFTAVAVISSITLLFSYGLTTGGPIIMVWGWIIGSLFTNIVGLSLGEICSSYPSAGSVYHWAGMLANERWAPVASYYCGWFNFIGNAAGDASFAFAFAQMTAATVSLSYDYNYALPVQYQVCIAIGVSFLWVIKNLARIDHQGWLNNLSGIYQILSTIIIIASILIATQMLSKSDFVWFLYVNKTGLINLDTGKDDGGTRLYVCCIGLLMCLFSFSGYEGAAHMSEETTNASEAAPKGIIFTCIATALTGFTYLLGLLYAAGCADQSCIDNKLINGNSANPTVNVFTNAFTTYDDLGNVISYRKAGALAMAIMILINLFFAGFSSMTVTSRIGYAMARDGVFPGSKCLAYVSQSNKVPISMIILVFIIDCLLCLLPLQAIAPPHSPIAFVAITGITTIGYQISYMIPILLRVTVSKNSFVKSKVNLGHFSIIFGWISVIWLSITSCFFIFPTQFDENLQQTATNFNYTCVVVGLVLIFATIYWFLPKSCGGARHFFTGPKRTDNDAKGTEQIPISDREVIEKCTNNDVKVTEQIPISNTERIDITHKAN